MEVEAFLEFIDVCIPWVEWTGNAEGSKALYSQCHHFSVCSKAKCRQTKGERKPCIGKICPRFRDGGKKQKVVEGSSLHDLCDRGAYIAFSIRGILPISESLLEGRHWWLFFVGQLRMQTSKSAQGKIQWCIWYLGFLFLFSLRKEEESCFKGF